MSSVPSVEPSLTITHLMGCTVCATTDFMVSSIKSTSFRAGVIRTYFNEAGILVDLTLITPLVKGHPQESQKVPEAHLSSCCHAYAQEFLDLVHDFVLLGVAELREHRQRDN